MQNTREILLKILSIIDYAGDADEFAEKFLEGCRMHTVIDLIKSLPDGKQQELEKIATQDIHPEDVFNEYFTNEEYVAQLEKTTTEIFKDYILSLTPTLNDDQRENLKNYLSTLS